MERDEERELNYWAERYGLVDGMRAALRADDPDGMRASPPERDVGAAPLAAAAIDRPNTASAH